MSEIRAGRSDIESRWGRDFSPVQTGPVAHLASRKLVTRSFPWVKYGRGVLLNTHPLLVPRSWRIKLFLYPTSGPHQACNGITLPLPLLIYKKALRNVEQSKTQIFYKLKKICFFWSSFDMVHNSHYCPIRLLKHFN